MNIINAIRSLFYKKTMTADEWKKGALVTDYVSDKGVSTPYAQSTIVYVASSTIAQNLPQAPLEFFNESTMTRLPVNSPLVRLFRRPNETQTYFTFFEELTLFLALYGETFIHAGQSVGQAMGTSRLPGRLQTLNPTRMQHVIEDGRLKGWIYEMGTERYAFTPEEIFQIKFPNPYNPLRGLAPIDSVRSDVDTDFLAARYAKAFFQNSANPALVFTLPEDDESSADQRKEFLTEWNVLRKGVSKFGKAAVLNPGMDIKTVGLTQEEMDYIKQREFSAERILSVYKVPPPMAGFYEQATYGNVRTAKKIFWNETIKTYAKRYESALNNFFLTQFAPGTRCKFNFSDIDELKHDMKETSEIVNVYANHGVPMNVLRDAFDLPWDAIDGLDTGYQPMTMLPVGTNFIELQQGTEAPAKSVETRPSIFNESLTAEQKIAKSYWDGKVKEAELNQIEKEFQKNLHNYFYRQREKLLKKLSKDINLVDKDFWKQENERLEAKFDPIYTKMNKKFDKSRTTKDLLSINVLNRNLVQNLIDKYESEDLLDKIREIYGNFDKKLKNMEDSRVNLISRHETRDFLEQTINRRP